MFVPDLKVLVGDREPRAQLDVAGGELDQQRRLREFPLRLDPAAACLAIGGKGCTIAFIGMRSSVSPMLFLRRAASPATNYATWSPSSRV